MADADEPAPSGEGPPRWLEPMAATLAPDARPPSGEWVFERKLDGVRVLASVSGDDVKLLSRNRIRQEDVYPEVVDALAEVTALDVVLDGEVVAFDGERTSFERLQQRMGVHDEARSRRSPVAVTYLVFDVLWLAGRDVRGLPWRDRRALLTQVLDSDQVVQPTEVLHGDPDALLAHADAQGWEGLIAKRAASTYQGRRSRDWLKLKLVRQQEVVVVGFTEPSGSRSSLGALLVGYHTDGRLRFGGKVGTGFSQAVLRSLRARLEPMVIDAPPVVDPPAERGVHWVRPELVAQVGFGEWSAAGRLRHPRYLGLREDKDPADVVREE
ncbi:non-homologous end-joining DNA ligase [Iamia sp.]|uniref:non-homologous end-joining DNA ligase n=1 Tax=Iamia sp. TaxID=2722710 RepID=UPI002D0D39C9|nr:non-homologous end-joining DNA ligase [Iamia sp.]HXH57752.1 non-homologous end-joining DNA ligase [Iamia sp.]